MQIGFSDVNVRALCDVGRSTKTGGLGYIGQKGIGWKSVFRVGFLMCVDSTCVVCGQHLCTVITPYGSYPQFQSPV